MTVALAASGHPDTPVNDVDELARDLDAAVRSDTVNSDSCRALVRDPHPQPDLHPRAPAADRSGGSRTPDMRLGPGSVTSRHLGPVELNAD